MADDRQVSQAFTPISYNTEPYLRQRLADLQKDGLAVHWLYIRHRGEYDYSLGRTDKDHWHVFIRLEPSARPRVESLLAFFKEPDLTKPDKPLGCVYEPSAKQPRSESFRLANWLLYVIHDPQFEQAKPDREQHSKHYKFKDIVTDDPEWLSKAIQHFRRRGGEFDELRRPSLEQIGALVLDGKLTANEALARRWIRPQDRKPLREIERDRAMHTDHYMYKQRVDTLRQTQDAKDELRDIRQDIVAKRQLLDETIQMRNEYNASMYGQIEKTAALLQLDDGKWSPLTSDDDLPF